MARSYDRPAPFKTSHPFRSAPPYRHVQSEAELADDYLRMIGADPRPELGQYEGTPIPGVRRKAIPPADLDEQFKRGRTASVHMKQRRQAKKSSHRKNNPFMVTTGGQPVPADPRQRIREQSVSDFLEHGTPMNLAGGGHRVPRKVQGLEERGTRYRIVRGSDDRFHIVDAATGTPTGKYGMTAENAQKVLEKFIGRSNPAPSLDRAAEAVIAELSKRIKRQKARSNPAQTLRPIEPDRGARSWKVVAGRTVRDSHGFTHVGERPGVPSGYPGVRWYVTRPGQPEALFTVLRANDVDQAAEFVRIRLADPDMQGGHFPEGTTHRLELQRAAERRISRKNNPSPVPGISVEEVIADVQGEEWANWAYNRAGIMHWR